MTDDDTETIMVPVEVELDGVHAPAWEELKAASANEDAAREQLGEVIGHFADTDAAVYRCYQQVKQQRQQAMQGMVSQMQAQQDGEEGEEVADAD
jgi:hypothetical protein